MLEASVQAIIQASLLCFTSLCKLELLRRTLA